LYRVETNGDNHKTKKLKTDENQLPLLERIVPALEVDEIDLAPAKDGVKKQVSLELGKYLQFDLLFNCRTSFLFQT
jgi:hypothetical protein